MRSRHAPPSSKGTGPNGTRMRSGNVRGASAVTNVTANSHSPLRHCQLPRTICGRGYSRHAFSGVTLSPHAVVSVFVIVSAMGIGAFAAAAHAADATSANVAKHTEMESVLHSIFFISPFPVPSGSTAISSYAMTISTGPSAALPTANCRLTVRPFDVASTSYVPRKPRNASRPPAASRSKLVRHSRPKSSRTTL